MTARAWAALASLVGILALLVATWFYRGHLDAAATQAALRKLELQQAQAAELADDQAARDTRALQAAADVRAGRLQQQLDSERANYAQAIDQGHAELQRQLAGCTVPAAAVGVLNGAPVPGGGPAAPAAGAGPEHAAGGAMAAAAYVEWCEAGRAAFERNAERLRACVEAYDAAGALNAPKH